MTSQAIMIVNHRRTFGVAPVADIYYPKLSWKYCSGSTKLSKQYIVNLDFMASLNKLSIGYLKIFVLYKQYMVRRYFQHIIHLQWTMFYQPLMFEKMGIHIPVIVCEIRRKESYPNKYNSLPIGTIWYPKAVIDIEFWCLFSIINMLNINGPEEVEKDFYSYFRFALMSEPSTFQIPRFFYRVQQS